MKNKLLVVQGALMPALEARLVAQYDTVLLPPPSPSREAVLAAEGAGIEGLATSARFGADAALIAALPQLQVISSFGVGLDTLDLDAARARGIAVGYTPDVLNDCVADTAFALLMDVARRISAADRFVRRGDWLRGQFPTATKVSGKRLGILGMGRIGRVIARRASGFDMEVRYHNRHALTDVDYPYAASLKELAEWADFLVIASAGGADTQGLVSAEILDALGPQGYLVNISRGTVVDEAALVDALAHNRIAGAGLDVFAREPQVPAALAALDNVVLLPHLASNTRETRAAMAQRVEDNLAAFFAGRPLVSAAL
ncbi:2-hydroxyacid dehydrogenase [Xylophilus ampelinus]|uniref:Lactate dehydrogenase-like 2-hydroxyacid dehydrogenase n=1 Tax=Xylophilus ampelinus TaxID=54067 RepID=A0A318SQU7_9BURK|nr:2-hydroxyacid dehydrogenase [Xylophilus ampelinus]MCS4509175.1 2-hydroxyacid dehydrogenase [Xylophilus ampelinus]PYE79799.1 lactate dehydrogenase-like 2-hydroxyacid dehydrogenase [Xylophilus ampelinus]